MNYAELFFRLTKKRVLYNIMPIKNIPTVIKHGIFPSLTVKQQKIL